MARASERGVTLVELLVAMIILAVALVGLAASFPAAMYGVSIGGFQTTATLAAEQCIEVARDMARSGVATVTQSGLTAQNGCGSSTAFGPGFVRTVTVQDGATFGGSPPYPASVTVVTVTVTFTNTPSDPTPVISTTLRTILGD